MQYCIQNEKDKDRYNEITEFGKNLFIMEEGKKKVVPPCFAEEEETTNLRGALADLYSYCLVNIFSIVVFMFVVYYQLKRVTRIHNHYHANVKEDLQKVLPLKKEKKVVEEEGGVGATGGSGDGAGDAH